MLADVRWRSTVKVHSVAELDVVLDTISKEVSPERPQAVNITRTNGDCLTIVLGAKCGSLLSFVAHSGDPPYYVSLGDATANGVFTYFVDLDHHSEALACHVISEADARQAVREFILHPFELPTNVTWSEV